MTETEIMKALECCCDRNITKCIRECPLKDFDGECYSAIKCDILALLNRKNAECKECGIRTSECIEKLQKQLAEKDAEIERLKKAIQVQEFMLENQDYKIKKAMGGAIESFAERLKKCFCNFPIWGKVAVGFMEEVAKEMGVEL